MKFFQKTIVTVGLILLLLSGGISLAYANQVEPNDSNLQNPVVAFLAGLTDFETQEIVTLQETGYGLGQIAQAYHFSELNDSSDDLVSIMDQAQNIGWGELYKELGYEPNQQKGLGWLFKEGTKPEPQSETNGPPDHANNDKDKEDANNGNNGNNGSDKENNGNNDNNGNNGSDKENNGNNGDNDSDKENKGKDKDKDKEKP